jgi:hypothetical protein
MVSFSPPLFFGNISKDHGPAVKKEATMFKASARVVEIYTFWI